MILRALIGQSKQIAHRAAWTAVTRGAAVALALGILASAGFAAEPRAGVGLRFDELSVGKLRYRDVEVRSVTDRTVVVKHADGVASLLLRDLPPALQQTFGYDPAAERAAEERLAKAPRERAVRATKVRRDPQEERTDQLLRKFERLLQDFGQTPELSSEIDLRPRFIEQSLGIKNQGRRPSCSVFAIVSALEYQNAELSGHPEKLSEEYLIWATRRATQRVAPLRDPGESGDVENSDAGFALSEVVAALRAYGIPLQASVPNTFGTKMDDIAAPPLGVIEEARVRRRVFVHLVPGREPETRIANIVHALNAGVPVAIGIRWPHYRTLRAGFLSEQKPILNYAHAVTLVGYSSPTRLMEDTVFLFKNSYGPGWGEGGYGRVTFGYLKNYLLDGVFLEVQPPAQKS